MDDLPPIPVNDNMDWTPEQCLEFALENVKWMRKNCPEGLEGVAVIFHYNQEHESRDDPDDIGTRYYLLSGMSSMEFVALCSRAAYMRLEGTYKNTEAE